MYFLWREGKRLFKTLREVSKYGAFSGPYLATFHAVKMSKKQKYCPKLHAAAEYNTRFQSSDVQHVESLLANRSK